MTKQIAAVCYDFQAISRFLRSVATAQALQQTTRTEWVEYTDSAVLNGIYTMLFWKTPPGTVEIRSADPRQLQGRINDMHKRYVDAWLRKVCNEGPLSADKYIKDMEKAKESAKDSLRELYRDVGAINSEIVGATKETIQTLARIKLGAAVGVAAISGVVGVQFAMAAMGGAAAGGGVSLMGMAAGGNAGTFGAVGFANSLTHAMIKSYEQAPSATAVAINLDTGKELLKYAASEGGGKAAEFFYKDAARNAEHAQQIIRSAQGVIRQQSERLAQQTLKAAAQRKAHSMIGGATRQVATQAARQQASLARAGVARAAGVGVPVVFAALDVIDAWGDYRATMGDL